jgi:hypothetical protein
MQGSRTPLGVHCIPTKMGGCQLQCTVVQSGTLTSGIISIYVYLDLHEIIQDSSVSELLGMY